jgi:CBS domain-containing protein
MKCGQLMNTNLEMLREKDTVQAAAGIMAETGVGFLPICDADGRAIGVVTDRDITTRGVAKGLAGDFTLASKIMSAPAITIPATADLRLAEELMAEERKSRLVITDEDGRVAGVLSLADLIEQAPARQALRTAKAVLWREALGPRGGALPEEPLLKDDPEARAQAAQGEKADGVEKTSVFTGGHWSLNNMKEFPG